MRAERGPCPSTTCSGATINESLGRIAGCSCRPIAGRSFFGGGQAPEAVRPESAHYQCAGGGYGVVD
jgi:hypothetical protein